MVHKLIKTETDYHKALARLEKIFHAQKGTHESDEADLLSLLIERYENEHYAIESPDPIAAIKYRMEQQNLKRKDLTGLLGGKDKVSRILNKQRKLTISMIRNLHHALQIPLSSLVQEY